MSSPVHEKLHALHERLEANALTPKGTDWLSVAVEVIKDISTVIALLPVGSSGSAAALKLHALHGQLEGHVAEAQGGMGVDWWPIIRAAIADIEQIIGMLPPGTIPGLGTGGPGLGAGGPAPNPTTV